MFCFVLFFSRTARYWYFSFGCVERERRFFFFFLLFLFFFIRVYSSFFFLSIFAGSSESTCAGSERGGLSVARLMTRAPSDNTRTAKIVLNVTKQGERERTILISLVQEKKERERYFLVPSVFRLEAGPVVSATRWSYLRMVGVESRFTGMICKLKSNERTRESFLKEKPFHRLRVINIREKTNNSFSLFFSCYSWRNSKFFFSWLLFYLSLIGFRSLCIFFLLLITNTFYTVSSFFFIIQFPWIFFVAARSADFQSSLI